MSKYAFITNTDSNTISVVDLQLNEEVKQIAIGDSPRGAMAIDKSRGFGFVSNCAGNTISVVNLKTGFEEKKIEVGLAPRGVDISPDNKWLYVANSGSATVSVVDMETQNVVHTIEVERNPRQLQVTPDGKFVFVPNFGSDSVSIIEVNTADITKSQNISNIFLGKNAKPYHSYPNEDGTLIFTANTFGNSISVVSRLENKVLKTIKVGYNPRAVITEPTGKYLLVSAEASNALSVVSRETWQEVKRIPVGATPRGLAINPDNNTILITAFQRMMLTDIDLAYDRVSVVSLDNLTRVGDVPTGLGACSLNIIDSEEIEEFFVNNPYYMNMIAMA
ncbi:YncE family protein [Streptococcus gallolyticus]|uniref:YncE family protein n=1 Tax=Streptococcus gallolyticus TaxID=315405 RepID=UPI003D2FA60D